MSDSQPASANRAVFVSYAREDTASAQRIAEALRVGGVEVWLDQEGGLVGGDAWDRKIREQIGSCTLFVPLISANTQARHEGYFRLEWKLAEDRSHLIAKGKPFIVPVSVDGTNERGALVPDAFLAVQWTKLPLRQAQDPRPADDGLAAFVTRVQKLLGGPATEPTSAARPVEAQGRITPAAPAGSHVSADVAVQHLERPGVVRLPFERVSETLVPPRGLWRRALPLAFALVFGVLLTVAVAWRLWPTAAPVTRFTFPLPEGQVFLGTGRNVVAISPDGTQLVYAADRRLYLRSMSQLEARPIPGIEVEQGAFNPVFSPDGLYLAFQSSADRFAIKRISVTGGATVTLCKADRAVGISWGPDGIVFGQGAEGIMRVSPNGGAPEPLVDVKPGEQAHDPQMLPDGRTVLFTLATGTGPDRWDKARIVAQTVKSGQRKILIEGGSAARYLPTGHLVYAQEGVLFAVAFDPGRLETAGGPVPVVEGVRRSFAAAHFSVSATGTLIYRPGPVSTGFTQMSLGFFDRKGAAELLKVPPGPYELPRLSPDGKQIAFAIDDGKGATIWIYELSGASAVRRLTFDGQGNNRFPVWSADSQRVTFQSDRERDLGIFWQRADGAGAAERLVTAEPETACIPESWSPDGTRLLYNATSKDAMSTLWMFSSEDKKTERFGAVVSPTPTLTGAVFSPDGKWVAYTSLRSGSSHAVYVQPVPPTGAKYQISKNEDDGHHPVWSPDGKELIFTPGSGDRLHVVSISTQPAFSFGEPVALPRPFRNLSPAYERPYDISRDGQRFLGSIEASQSIQSARTDASQIQVVLNWFDELNRKVPVK